MDALLKELLPKGKNKDQIEQKIINNEGVISNNRDALELLQKQMGKSGSGDATLEVVMKYYASLTAEVAAKELENIELRKGLLVKGEEVFVQKANLPERKSAPKRSLIAIMASLVCGFALLLWVFVRKVWLAAVQDAGSARKVASIKQNLGFK
jgi:LPS O-antigen subunit length determinant protein (WzzB/FepE family)